MLPSCAALRAPAAGDAHVHPTARFHSAAPWVWAHARRLRCCLCRCGQPAAWMVMAGSPPRTQARHLCMCAHAQIGSFASISCRYPGDGDGGSGGTPRDEMVLTQRGGIDYLNPVGSTAEQSATPFSRVTRAGGMVYGRNSPRTGHFVARSSSTA